MNTILKKEIQNDLLKMLSRWGYQESDDKDYDCWRMYFGENELDMGDQMDVNSILVYPDGAVVSWNEGEGCANLFEFDENTQIKLLNEVAKAVTADDNFLSYIASLGITEEQIRRGAERDGEKPMGYLLSYLRDMTGLSKTAVWQTAEKILKNLGIDNEGKASEEQTQLPDKTLALGSYQFTMNREDWEFAGCPICMELADIEGWNKVEKDLSELLESFSADEDEDSIEDALWREYENSVLKNCKVFYYEDMTDEEYEKYHSLQKDEEARKQFARKVYERIKGNSVGQQCPL